MNVDKLAACKPIFFINTRFTIKLITAAIIVVIVLRMVSFDIWYPKPRKLHKALNAAPRYKKPEYCQAVTYSAHTNSSITICVIGIAATHKENNKL